MCFIILFGCTPNQEKLEKYASLKAYDELYAYIDDIDKKTKHSRRAAQIYYKHKARLTYAFTTLIATQDSAILENIEERFYRSNYSRQKRNILRAFNNNKTVFKEKNRFYKYYSKVWDSDERILCNWMLAEINDWKCLRSIINHGVNKKKFLNSYPMNFFKNHEVQKIRYELELAIFDEEDRIGTIEKGIISLEKTKNEYSYRELSGIIIQQLEPGFYEIQLPYYNRRSILQAATRFTSKGYFSVNAGYLKKVPMNTVGGFTDDWEVWVEVDVDFQNKYAAAMVDIRTANKKLENAKAQRKALQRKIKTFK